MKTQVKTSPARRTLIGRNEFPPFRRNQIRWALHCYRWKAGLSWEKYPYEIAHALGIRELGEGLNSRDPRGFVLEGQTPTPEKLRLYERFIQKVAPEYARAFTEEDFTSTLADYVGRYLNPDWERTEHVAALLDSATRLERLVYFEPCPATFNFEQKSLIWMSVFRRIGDTPFLRVISVTFDAIYLYQARLESFAPSATTEDEIAAQRHAHMFEAVVDLSFGDDFGILEMWTGVAVPMEGGKGYLAFYEDQVKQRYIAQLAPCSATTMRVEGDWAREYVYGNSGPDASHIDTFLFKAYAGATFLPSVERMLMFGLVHEAAQSFFAAMKYGS